MSANDAALMEALAARAQEDAAARAAQQRSGAGAVRGAATYPSKPAAPVAQTKRRALLSRARMRQQRAAIERWSAWPVLTLSWLGTIVAFHPQGWADILAGRFSIGATLGGVLVQAVLTFFQWWYFDQPLVSLPARLIDAFLTALGYAALVLGWLAGAMGLYAAVAVLMGLGLLVAWWPESRLVGD